MLAGVDWAGAVLGYVQGGLIAAGVGVQIGIGILSGGATAGACTGSIVRAGILAAKTLNYIDMASSAAGALYNAGELASNAGQMTSWQIAGSVASIGLNLAPVGGFLGGGALKKLNGPDFLEPFGELLPLVSENGTKKAEKWESMLV